MSDHIYGDDGVETIFGLIVWRNRVVTTFARLAWRDIAPALLHLTGVEHDPYAVDYLLATSVN